MSLSSPHPRFSLVLMVNHACNLRCTYCYTGAKTNRPMSATMGERAIERALDSMEAGGTLELGFFGGEPLLEATLISRLLAFARLRARESRIRVVPGLTTNGTVAGPEAWQVLTLPDLNLAISFDGLPAIHDRHRLTLDGRASSSAVLHTMERLDAAGKEFHVVAVVRPDTLDSLPEGVEFLRDRGVRTIDLSLDLWTEWTRGDLPRLECAMARVARLWGASFPDLGISWFNEKTARLGRLQMTESARCGFGVSEIAVAPSGRLYPCERLIGEDREDAPMRLPGHALEDGPFRDLAGGPPRADDPCGQCTLESACTTTCRCSNYVRTGRTDRPDGLLCFFEKICARETVNALEERARGRFAIAV